MPGSVFDNPTIGQKLKRIGTGIAPFVAGTALPVAAGTAAGALAGPEVSAPTAIATRVGAQAVAGALTPYAEYLTSKVMGQHPDLPTAKQVIHSTVLNGALAGLGEAGGALAGKAQVADEVRGELSKLPQSERTLARTRQIRKALEERTAKASAEAAKISSQDLRNRDFWKAQGLNDQQIDEVMSTPELEEQAARSIQQADKIKGAYQAVRQHARTDFTKRYDDAYGALAQQPVDPRGIGQQMEQWGQGEGQHELTPSWRGFLQRKGLELTKAGDIGGPSVGGVPWKQLPEKLKEQLRTQGAAQGLEDIGNEQMSISQLRDLRTELREQLPSNPTNLDKKAYQQITAKIDELHDQTLRENGATEEQIGRIKGIDADYGRWMDTVRKLDPTSEKFGEDVANELYSSMAKNPAQARNFILMAKAAEQARPGEVMPQLREGFLNKAIAETRKPGQPFEELKALRKLQNTWGGDQAMRAVTGEIFGKDSPLADPTKFTRVVEAASDPEPIAHRAAQNVGHSILHSSYMQGMVLYGVGAATVLGIDHGGLWNALSGGKGPAAQALAIGSLLLGPQAIGWAARSGNSPLQRALLGFITNPNSANMVRYAGQFAGSFSGAVAGESAKH